LTLCQQILNSQVIKSLIDQVRKTSDDYLIAGLLKCLIQIGKSCKFDESLNLIIQSLSKFIANSRIISIVIELIEVLLEFDNCKSEIIKQGLITTFIKEKVRPEYRAKIENFQKIINSSQS
jgi:hypothetical protein